MKQAKYPEYGAWKGAKRKGCVASWAVAKKGFWNFLDDVGRRPGLQYTLTRLDSTLPFSKANCKWKKQAEKLTVRGETKTIGAWAKVQGISPALIRKRLREGMPIPYAVLNPKRQLIWLSYNGERRSLKEWAKVTGIRYKTLFARFQKGMSPGVILKGAVKAAQRDITYKGVTKSILAWSRELGIPHSTLCKRLETWSIDRALGTKRQKFTYYALYSKEIQLGVVRVTDSCSWREMFRRLKGKQPTLLESKTLSLKRITKKEFDRCNSTKV